MFTLIRQESLPALGLDFAEFRHEATGAVHLHLHMPGELHAFDLSFRTLPEDESGVAHILEHSVLEGSRRFPVPGMFHKRSSSSFSVFSNAMTGRDLTHYLFHTPLDKDFEQLLDMYLDACFFPLLERETFAQEGHRLEPSDPADPASPLNLTGVVFNEMKANYANPVSRAVREILAGLLPGSVYSFDSGGNPAVIPQLRHEQFLAFHRRFYCPANARFHYCGPLAPEELQRILEERVLGPLSAEPGQLAPVPPFTLPAVGSLERRLGYPFSGQDTQRKGLGLLAWRLGRQPGLEDDLVVQVLVQWLAGSSEAPLLRSILEAEMGGPLVSLLPVGQEPILLLGAQGMELERMEENLDRLLAELERLADAPLDPELLVAITNQLRLEMRGTEDEDAGGGAFPMQLLDRVREAGRRNLDPLTLLNPAATLESLRPRLCDPDFIRGELRQRLLESPNRMRLILVPDEQLGRREAEAEAAWIAEQEARLTGEERQALALAARELQQHRENHDRDHLIPVLHLQDVDRRLARDPLAVGEGGALRLRELATPSNGLAHLDLQVELPTGSLDETRAAHWLGYLTEFGYGRLDHEAADLRRRSLGAPLSCGYELLAPAQEGAPLEGCLSLRGCAMVERAEDYAEMMRLTVEEPRLEDGGRWSQFLGSWVASWQRLATDWQVHGHLWLALGSVHSRQAWLKNEVEGFPGLLELRTALAGEGLPSLLERIWERQRVAARAPRTALLAAEATSLDLLREGLRRQWGNVDGAAVVGAAADQEWAGERISQAWLTDSTVNYAGLSWRALSRQHEDWVVLKVATALLDSLYLHPRIREQGGAYGAMAQCHYGHVLLATYRDPRLGDSLTDLRGAWDWLLTAEIPARKVEEAALGALKGLLLAQSPVARVRHRLGLERQGLTAERLERDIACLRRVDLDQVREVVRLHVERASEFCVVVCSQGKLAADGLKGFHEREI